MGIVVSGCVLIIQEDIWGHRNILSKCHAGDFLEIVVAFTQCNMDNISLSVRPLKNGLFLRIVVSGCVLIIQEDIWGHRNILSKCHAGDFFGEPYAASQRAVLNISVVADEDCEIILLNVKRLLITCPTACEHHQKLIRNLVSVLAKRY